MDRATALTTAVLVAACSSPTPPRKGRLPSSAASSPAKRGPDVFDYRHYAVLRRQAPPAGYTDIHHAGAWPAGGFHHAVHYHRGYAVHLDNAVAGCTSTAVAPDGTLCPSVVLPGDPLSHADAARLVALYQRKRKGPPRAIMCVRNAEHSVVLYDAADRPISELAVSLTRCPGWTAAPGDDRAFQDSSVSDDVAALCDELGWGSCHADDAAVPALDTGDFFGMHGVDARRLTTTPPLTRRHRKLSTTTLAERRELCVWNSTHTVDLRPPGKRIGLQNANDPQTYYVGQTLDWVSCVQRFPRCEQTVGELLPCMEIAQRGDPWFMHEDNARCRPHRSCIWGFEARIVAADEAARYLDE